MAGFTDTLRGYGLVRAQTTLLGLERDPERLDRARRRFSDSPPPYTSDRSGTTTRSVSPNPPSEEQRRRQERRMQLAEEREASKPDKQFSDQVEEERRRIWSVDPKTSWMSMPPGDILIKEASEAVKKHWVEQGIWNSQWNQFADGLWKHEEPLELESESKTDPEAGLSSSHIVLFPKPQPKPRRPKSDDERQRIVERRVTREREREASRPYHQFIYQISKARERIQEECGNGEGADASDINTRAYEIVKNTWTKRGIWNGRWSILPGMSWKHEEPFQGEADGPARLPAEPSVYDSNEAGEAPAVHIFGSPSPVESNHHQTSGALNPPQQGPSADIDSTELEIGDAQRSSSFSKSPPPSSSKRVLRPPTGQALLPSKRKTFHEDERRTNASLGLAHPSKVSKAAGKRKRPQRRLNISQEVSSDGLQLSSGVNAAKRQLSPPPDRVTPRRSKRIQPPVSGVAKDPAKRAVRSKPERKIANNLTTKSSAKPQGVSKRALAKTTQGKARKK